MLQERQRRVQLLRHHQGETSWGLRSSFSDSQHRPRPPRCAEIKYAASIDVATTPTIVGRTCASHPSSARAGRKGAPIPFILASFNSSGSRRLLQTSPTQHTQRSHLLVSFVPTNHLQMPRVIISPSVLASDFGQLNAECSRMMKNGAEWLHMGE